MATTKQGRKGFNLTRLLSVCAVLAILLMLGGVIYILEAQGGEHVTDQAKIEDLKVQIAGASAREAELKARIDKTFAATTPAPAPVDSSGGSPIPKILHLIWISPKGVAPPLPTAIQARHKFMKDSHEKQGWEVADKPHHPPKQRRFVDDTFCRFLTPSLGNPPSRWQVKLWHNELWERYKDDPFVIQYRKQFAKETHTIAFICDYMRLLLLRDFGGVFSDVDAILVPGMTFEKLRSTLAPQIRFFAGMRNLDDNPDTVLDVAVLGATPQSPQILGAISVYHEKWVFDNSLVVPVIHMLPQGGNVGRWINRFLDTSCFILGHHYFYDNKITEGQTIVLNTDNLGTWRMGSTEAFAVAWKDDAQRIMMAKMISRVQGVLTKKGVKHFLGGMSLLGYARNRTILAWETGTDLVVDKAWESRIKDGEFTQELDALGYKTVPFWGGTKVFPKSEPLIKPYQWAFPFADIVYFDYGEGSSKYAPLDTQYEAEIKAQNGGSNNRVIQNDLLFPPIHGELEGFPVEIPGNFNTIAEMLFGKGFMKECKSRRWDSANEKALRGVVIKECKEIAEQYPFHPEWRKAIGLPPAK